MIGTTGDGWAVTFGTARRGLGVVRRSNCFCFFLRFCFSVLSASCLW